MPAPRHALLLLLAPLPAIAVGAAVAGIHGVPTTVFLPNVLAAVLGAVGASWLVSSKTTVVHWAGRWLPIVSSMVIVATLVTADLDGVRRWVSIGPLRLNASSALLPWIFLGMISPGAQARMRAALLACAVQLVHWAQPDAAQATALALGSLPLLAGGTVVDRRLGIPIGVLLLGLAAAAWSRPDSLPAVDHVERILVLAAESGTWWSAAAGVATLALVAPAMLAMRKPDAMTSHLGAGLALHACATIGATFFGSYPVPVLGAGAGPVLGWYAMIAVVGIGLTDAHHRGGTTRQSHTAHTTLPTTATAAATPNIVP